MHARHNCLPVMSDNRCGKHTREQPPELGQRVKKGPVVRFHMGPLSTQTHTHTRAHTHFRPSTSSPHTAAGFTTTPPHLHAFSLFSTPLPESQCLLKWDLVIIVVPTTRALLLFFYIMKTVLCTVLANNIINEGNKKKRLTFDKNKCENTIRFSSGFIKS